MLTEALRTHSWSAIAREKLEAGIGGGEGEVVFGRVDPGVGQVDVVLDLLGFDLGEFFEGEGSQFGELELQGGGGDGLVRVHVGRGLGELELGGGDGGDRVLFDFLGDAAGGQAGDDAIKESLAGAQHDFLRLAEGAADFDAAQVAAQDAREDFDGILGVRLQLLLGRGDLLLQAGVEVSKGDFFHGEGGAVDLQKLTFPMPWVNPFGGKIAGGGGGLGAVGPL